MLELLQLTPGWAGESTSRGLLVDDELIRASVNPRLGRGIHLREQGEALLVRHASVNPRLGRGIHYVDTEDPQTILELLQLTPGWAGESTKVAATPYARFVEWLQLTPGWAGESTPEEQGVDRL